jgi:hypothetical protein
MRRGVLHKLDVRRQKTTTAARPQLGEHRMRRGGNWSWKWFAINAFAWFTVLWTTVEAGNYFEVDVFNTLKGYKLKGLLAMLGIALVLSPITYIVVKILNGAVRRRLEDLARNEQKINPNCRLLFDQRKFHECQMRIAREATEYIFATGSRSRDVDYLNLIEKRIRSSDTLVYTRILFGEIKRDELKHHCVRLSTDTSLRTRAKICEITDLARYTEAFFIINEKEALVVIPSLNAIGKFDTGLVMKGPMHSKIYRIVENYARAATPWLPTSGATP